ncbi:methyltransferase domain-containing protein [Deltaproteobacteria bacterium OttesenSCG-928-M10]|nr:methyltransferase domain-containing protein [Deltaproteobacteria bacterium OttesenSCG-928-M10]
MAEKQWSPKDLFSLFSFNWQACAIQAGVNLDLFTALDNGPDSAMSLADLARRINVNERALGMLVTALTAMGFLDRDGETVCLTADSRRYLSAKSDDYYGFMVKHSSNILPAWTRLAEAVRTGRSTAAISPADSDNEEERENFLMGMFNVARQQADIVAEALDLSGRKRLLDLGGGPGTYAVHFCRKYPELTATVFDQPATEKFARATVARFGLSGRIDFMGGHFLADPMPQGYDVAWLSQVLHGEAPPDAARLVANGASALAPGGLLCVQEFIIDDDRRGPAHSALFSLNMLVQTEGGQSYTESEIKELMTAAGITGIKRLQAQLPPGCGILTGHKAG